MDLSVDRAVESGLISEGDDILDLWFAKQDKEKEVRHLEFTVWETITCKRNSFRQASRKII